MRLARGIGFTFRGCDYPGLNRGTEGILLITENMFIEKVGRPDWRQNDGSGPALCMASLS